MLPIIQREVVTRRQWIGEKRDLLIVAQSLPAQSPEQRHQVGMRLRYPRRYFGSAVGGNTFGWHYSRPGNILLPAFRECLR